VARALGILCFAATLCTSGAWAKPQYKEALGRYYGSFLDGALKRCATCHEVPRQDLSPADEAKLVEESPEHNAFGMRLRELGKHLAAKNQPADLAARLKAAADEDADGDGVPNEIELLAGTRPGDDTSKPPAQRIAAATAQQRELRAQYRWEPWRTLTRPEVPAVRNPAWARNPIDAFIAAEHVKRGLKPRPEAPRHVLLRRVYLDLIGLPPTAEELQAFLQDNAPDAYEKVVDALLARPQYGERWGRHWMDVWRYSDWAGWGQQVRDSMPHVWRWRDWIIESLNADKPYDRMIQEMLAADELCPEDVDALRATGFLVRNFKLLSREQWMQDTVNHTTKAFLGLTLDCARCHNHMYDPVTQEEYYRFRAIFEPYKVRTDRVPGQVDVAKDGLVRAYDADAAAVTHFYVRGDERQPDKQRKIVPGVPAALGGAGFNAKDVALPLAARIPDKRPFVADDDLKAAAEAVAAAKQNLAAAQKKQPGDAANGDIKLAEADVALAEAKRAALEATIRVERLEEQEAKQREPQTWEKAAKEAVAAQRREVVADKRKARVAAEMAVAKAAAGKAVEDAKKNLAAAEEALKKAEQEAASPLTTNYKPPTFQTYPEKSTGRRVALARWIADARNPLTARVAVNQIWMRHIGQPLTASVFDFGNNGQPPTHPALLDWLAAELMQPSLDQVSSARGRTWQAAQNAAPAWSMKHLHRLIVTSSTYRMASTPDAACEQKDPDNRFLWRTPPRRMEAEVVRDCVLYVAGQLDLTRGGPDLDCNEGLRSKRRSLYFRHAPEKQMTFLRLFDAASPAECYRRKESIVPQQALALANSSLSLEQSRLLARKLHPRFADPRTFVQAAFEHVLSRPAREEEVQTCVAFLAEQHAFFEKNVARLTETAVNPSDAAKPSADRVLRARENLVHVLLNHHDFVTIH
jgi:hypothetical protein